MTYEERLQQLERELETSRIKLLDALNAPRPTDTDNYHTIMAIIRRDKLPRPEIVDRANEYRRMVSEMVFKLIDFYEEGKRDTD